MNRSTSALFALVIGSSGLGAACSAAQTGGPVIDNRPAEIVEGGPELDGRTHSDIVDPSAPARIMVPGIALDEPLIPLGIAPDRSMEVPEDAADAGWLTTAGRPGGYGPTVIAGHVDSASGPGVFYELTRLVPGDEVTVVTEDGESAHYKVTRVVDYPKNQFPTELVFGATFDDELRLITCTGDFDRQERSYRDNRVVFAVRT